MGPDRRWRGTAATRRTGRRLYARDVLSFALTAALVLPATGCMRGATPQQRSECRRARAAAFGRAVGVTVGIVVVAAVLVLANSSSSGLGRSRRRSRRRHRLAVCREARRAQSTTAVTVAQPRPPPPRGLPPEHDELQGALSSIESPLRQCVAADSGTLVIDASIDGAEGRVRDFGLRGEAASTAQPECIANALAGLQFRRFDGVVEVHWAIGF